MFQNSLVVESSPEPQLNPDLGGKSVAVGRRPNANIASFVCS